MVWLVLGCELLIGITLILGIAVRYSAVLTFVFLICGNAIIAHRYWTYPAPQQGAPVRALPEEYRADGRRAAVVLVGRGPLFGRCQACAD